MRDPSAFLVWSFAAVAIATTAAAVLVLRRAVRPGVMAGFFAMWLAVTYVLASAGALRFDTRPPTIALLILAANLGAAVFALSRVGARVAGWNFDIVTGALAIAVAFLTRNHAIVRAWNILGMLLLTAIVVISTISTPLPLRVFHNEPANVWIAHPPFVWLVTLLVPIALAGHILVFRALRRRRDDGAAR